jgi:vacuolar-type H+-ATPase subunit H
VLAQRTADLAVQEAREQASRILANAEQQAQAMLSEAEEQGKRTLEDTIADCRAELDRLEGARNQAQNDVDTLQRWLDEHKAHLQDSLSEAMAAVERAGVLWPAPSTRPVDPGLRSGAVPVPDLPPGRGELLDPDTAMWSPSDDERAELREGPASSRSQVDIDLADPDLEDQALDDFFDDNEEFADDRRFGGRLRRRR